MSISASKHPGEPRAAASVYLIRRPQLAISHINSTALPPDRTPRCHIGTDNEALVNL